MGILDQLESLAGGAAQQGPGSDPQAQQSSVSRALISAVAEHPGGVGGLLDHFRQNGLENHVNSWVNSEPGQTTPEPLSQQQVEQGVPSGILSSIATRTGMPPAAVSAALTAVLPMIMQHFTSGGQVPGQQQTGGLAQSLLSRFL